MTSKTGRNRRPQRSKRNRFPLTERELFILTYTVQDDGSAPMVPDMDREVSR